MIIKGWNFRSYMSKLDAHTITKFKSNWCFCFGFMLHYHFLLSSITSLLIFICSIESISSKNSDQILQLKIVKLKQKYRSRLELHFSKCSFIPPITFVFVFHITIIERKFNIRKFIKQPVVILLFYNDVFCSNVFNFSCTYDFNVGALYWSIYNVCIFKIIH